MDRNFKYSWLRVWSKVGRSKVEGVECGSFWNKKGRVSLRNSAPTSFFGEAFPTPFALPGWLKVRSGDG